MSEGYARQLSEITASANRAVASLSRMRESVEQASRFSEQAKAAIAKVSAPFDQLVLLDRLKTFFQDASEAHLLVSAALPERGWYLSGQEPCALSLSLAKAVQAGDWERVDQEVLDNLPEYDTAMLKQWTDEQGVPDYCFNRLCLFVARHQEGCYEEATYIGVPLIDEVALHLYEGKSFTTKRGNTRRGDQSKPELAFKTSSGPELEDHCSAFVQTFGSLQEDPDPTKLADEDYWNRHAIVHGMIQRALGMKDSAKCLMAINFLLFARKEIES